MTKTTKRMRDFANKISAIKLEGVVHNSFRDMHIQSLNDYANLVDQEWEILRLKVEQMKLLSEHTPQMTAKTAYENVLRMIGGITGER